jgi:hypothetical protein
VTVAGRFFGAFLAGAIEAAVGVIAAAGVNAGVAEVGAGPETLTSAGFEDCFVHALTASNSPRITKLAIIASFCWRDQNESVVPEIVLLVVGFVDF